MRRCWRNHPSRDRDLLTKEKKDDETGFRLEAYREEKLREKRIAVSSELTMTS